MIRNLLTIIVVAQFFICCEKTGSFTGKTKTDHNKNDNKTDQTQDNVNEEGSTPFSIEDDFIVVPQNISGSYLTCGIDPNLSSENVFVYGCLLNTSDDKKYKGKLENWKISVKDSLNQDHDISDVQPTKTESRWHITFVFPEGLYLEEFLVKAVFEVEGETARLASEKTIKKTKISDFEAGGADVGDKEMKAAVKECHENRMFYIRNLLKCSDEIKLAVIDCNIETIFDLLSTSQTEQFHAILKGDALADYEMDQCVKCTAGMTDNDDVCKNESGLQQEGLKIFFVKEKDSQIFIQPIIIPSSEKLNI